MKGLGCWAAGMEGRIASLIALGVQNHNHDDAWEGDAPGTCKTKAGNRDAVQGGVLLCLFQVK